MKKQLGNIIFGTNLEWKRLDEVEFLELKYDLMDSSEHWEIISNLICMFNMKNEHEFGIKIDFTSERLFGNDIWASVLTRDEYKMIHHILSQEIDVNMLYLKDYELLEDRCKLFKESFGYKMIRKMPHEEVEINGCKVIYKAAGEKVETKKSFEQRVKDNELTKAENAGMEIVFAIGFTVCILGLATMLGCF